MRRKCSILVWLFFALPLALAQLSPDFYSTRCPGAESTIFSLVQKRFRIDKSITAALLRIHFHDCFVNGCDASILIDSTDQNPSEKEAGPNLTVRGYELIDEIKKALEAECPSIVSCADIVTLAARDAVVLAGGTNYTAPTGRRDGLRSNLFDVDLPGPELTVPEAFQAFQAKGLTLNDMVILLGGHTVGIAHCSFFADRLSGFQGTQAADPTMNRTLVTKLRSICGAASSNNPDPTAFLDQNTNFIFDNKFYSEILLHRGLLQIDQELALDKSTAPMVIKFASNLAEFRQSFGNAMIKLGGIQVLVGKAGEIRKNCRAFNPVKPQQPMPKPINKGNKPKPINQGNKPKPIHQGNKPKPINEGNKPKPINQGKKPKPIELGKKQKPAVNKGKKPKQSKQGQKQKPKPKTQKPIKRGKERQTNQHPKKF